MPTLEFKGKQHIYANHLTVPYRPLVPDTERSLNSGGADANLIKHGDNIHALKALLPRYAGRVGTSMLIRRTISYSNAMSRTLDGILWEFLDVSIFPSGDFFGPGHLSRQ